VLSVAVDPFYTQLYPPSVTVAAFSDEHPSQQGYLARVVPGDVIGPSFYALSAIDFPVRHNIVIDDCRIAPTTALHIENDSIVGMYYVSSYRLGYEYLVPAYVDEVVYEKFSDGDVIALTPCEITPRVKEWAEFGHMHAIATSMDVRSAEPASSFNWLIVPAASAKVFRYEPGPGSTHYDEQGYLHLTTTEVTEPFYYIINLNVEVPPPTPTTATTPPPGASPRAPSPP
jgi:hypothetical protein